MGEGRFSATGNPAPEDSRRVFFWMAAGHVAMHNSWEWRASNVRTTGCRLARPTAHGATTEGRLSRTQITQLNSRRLGTVLICCGRRIVTARVDSTQYDYEKALAHAYFSRYAYITCIKDSKNLLPPKSEMGPCQIYEHEVAQFLHTDSQSDPSSLFHFLGASPSCRTYSSPTSSVAHIGTPPSCGRAL